MSGVIDRFLKYVRFNTQSNEDSTSVPSTAKQMKLAQEIVEELKGFGLHDVKLSEQGYVYATLPSNTYKSIPAIGFIAHMDTSPDFSGENVKPKLIEIISSAISIKLPLRSAKRICSYSSRNSTKSLVPVYLIL